MNELGYSFIGSLRAWISENKAVFQTNGIAVEIPAYDLHYGIRAQFSSDRFEAGFYVWEKRNWHVAMSEVEFADWQIARQNPDYQVEHSHYEYARISEMLEKLDALRDRLLLVQQDHVETNRFGRLELPDLYSTVTTGILVFMVREALEQQGKEA